MHKPLALFCAMTAAGFALAADAENNDAGDARVEEVRVYGRARALYRVPIVRTAKLPTEPLALSQSVTSITGQLIADQGARDSTDLYRNIAGVSQFTYGGVTARGFRQQEIFYDGLRGNPLVSFSVPQLFNIEQVDFLKGPAGMLYGPGAPGGLFNYITRKPTEEPAARLRAVGGDFERRGGSAEISGALGSPGTAGRLGLFREDRELEQFNREDNVRIYDAALSQQFGETRITLQATRYEQDQPGSRYRGGLVTMEGNFLTDITWNHNEPGDALELESDYINLRLEGSVLNGALDWNVSARRIDAVEVQHWHFPIVVFERPIPLLSDPDDVHRAYVDQRRDRDVDSYGANLVWSWQPGAFEHRVLAGFDAYREELRFLNGSALPELVLGEVPPISLGNPQYGRADPSTYDIGYTLSLTEQSREGGYVLNELSWGPLIATVGVRLDRFEDTNGVSGESFSDEQTTFRAGLVYRLRDDLSAYAQWADSFEPQDVEAQNENAGGPFDPQVGEMRELGVKAELLEGRIQGSAVAYDITRENLLQPDPRDPANRFVALGEVRSQGAELEMTVDITPHWVFRPSYAYNEVEIVDGVSENATVTNATGGEFANAPRHQFGLWTRYQFPAINLALAFGVDYLDERVGLAGQAVGSYTIYDASLIWTPGRWEVLVRIDNLTDEAYTDAGFIDASVAVDNALGPAADALRPYSGILSFPGESRTGFVEVSWNW